MPVYLLHGFRWPRPLIRIHIILQNLDDAAAEWLVAPNTTDALLDNFYELYPDVMERLPDLRFIEQYDPEDLSSSASSQPYAYVADMVEEIKLGLDIEGIRGREVEQAMHEAVTQLRNKLAPEEKIGWYIAVCGDEERWAPPATDEVEEDTACEGGDISASGSANAGGNSDGPSASNGENVSKPAPEPKPRGLGRLFSSYKSSKLSKKKSLLFGRFSDNSAQPGGPSARPVTELKRPQTSKA